MNQLAPQQRSVQVKDPIKFYTIAVDIASSGGSGVGSFELPASLGFNITSIDVQVYDNSGRMNTEELRHALFRMQMRDTQASHTFGDQSFDVRALEKMTQQSRFQGMYVPRGREIEVEVTHDTSAAAGASVDFPVRIMITFTGQTIVGNNA